MFKKLSKIIPIVSITATVLAGVVFALPAQASTQNHYVVQLYPGQKSVLKMIPGLQNIQLLPDLNNTYEFTSSSNLQQLRQAFDGFYVYLDSDTTFSNESTTTKKVIVTKPNDPGFTSKANNIDKQWGLAKANFINAWAKTIGQRTVTVAVVDTGIDAKHEDLAGTHFVTGYDVINKKTIIGRVNSDDNGHGTLISGVIAATTNNNIGIAGAAPGVSLMPIKALDSSGSGSSTKISEGIVWAADHSADVINLSLGGMGFSHDTTLANAISYAFSKNVVIVAAAGNDVAVTGGNLDKDPVFPICDDNGQNMIIGVTATDSNDLKPSFANYGKACVDVSAPGKRILSTINHDPASGGPSPDSYAYASGTSLSVPFVAAQAALLRSLFPDASNRQIRDRIIATADNIDNLNLSQCAGGSCAGYMGGGRINVANSLIEKILPIDDGDVVKVAGSDTLYLINGGKRQLISAFVKNQRFAGIVPKIVSSGDLNEFPEGSYAEPIDGTLVKSPNDGAIYYMQSGLRRPLTYQVFTMRGFKFKDVVTLTNIEVNSWIEGSFLAPPDGTIIKSTTNPTIYWVVNGILRPVNYTFYVQRGLNAFPVMIAPESDISKMPRGDAYIL